MRKMKDSGIEWIGEIPEDWDVSKVKYHLRRHETRNPGNVQVLSVYREYGVIPKNSRNDNHNVTSDDTSKYKYVKPGMLVINKMKAWQGSMGVSEYEGMVSPAYFIYKFVDPLLCGSFIHYLLRNVYKDEFRRISGGIREGQWDLPAEKFENTLLPIPPLSEQQRIADYLDTKCEEIDKLTTNIQKEIDVLKEYKKSIITEAVTKGLDPEINVTESPIYYMSPFNSKWKLSKIGYECNKLSRNFVKEDTPLICSNKGKILLRPPEMSGKMVSEDNAMQGIHKGDIAIHGMDTWHGAVAVSDYNGKITRVVHVCESIDDNRFIVYYLQQLAFNGVYKLISNGVRGNTSDFRSWDKVKNIGIALPDLEEQTKIADFLDTKCEEIDKIIKQKHEQLIVLEEYKKSLIYEYVTGKKEVMTS